MKSLLLDTSSFFVTIAALTDEKVISLYQENIVGDMASVMLPLIDQTLKKANITLEDLDRIYVVNGPGSFTGIRIGVAIAKTIAWAKKIDIIPLSSLELLASTDTKTKYNAGLIDARRGNAFAGLYDEDLNNVISDQLVNIDKFKSKLTDYTLISVNEIENAIEPKYNIEKIIKKHENDIPLNPHNLNPNYLKLTEAEENRLKEKHD
jgi:tRNA threonylcarbamoyl adenosine modification protein YeaZ